MKETKDGETINADRPRWILRARASEPADLTMYEAETVQTAIERATSVESRAWNTAGPNGEMRTVTLSVYLCPLLKLGRYAVTCETRSGTWIRDFRSETDARVYQDAECERLGIL